MRIDRTQGVEGLRRLRVEFKIDVRRGDEQHRPGDEARTQCRQQRLALSLTMGLRDKQGRAAIESGARLKRETRRRRGWRQGGAQEQIEGGLALQPPAPSGCIEVQQQAVGRPGRIGEGADKGGRGDIFGQIAQRVGRPRLSRGQPQPHPGIFGDTLLHLQQPFIGGRSWKQAVSFGAKSQGVLDGDQARRRIVRRQTAGQGAPFELQPIAPVQGVQMSVVAVA